MGVTHKLDYEKVAKYLAFIVVLLGIALRFTIYFQNRNLFQDEANVARNIYERDFIGLLSPLSYSQYAPPLFLWALKMMTVLFGYGERALRVSALLNSFGALCLMYLVLRKFGVKYSAWYPLSFLATGYIYLRYATEVKQYSSDGFIALLIVYAALSIDLVDTKPIRFFIIWALLGTIVIWSSMPSVFVLAGAGVYYFTIVMDSKAYSKAFLVLTAGGIWLVQFLFYYLTILRPQSQSGYLQNCHIQNFLFFLPSSMAEWKQNYTIFINVISVTAGHWTLTVIFHLFLASVTVYYAIKYRIAKLLLLFVPIILTLLAAGLHEFALTPRLILFLLYMNLIILGIGLERILSMKLIYVNALILILSIVCIFNFSRLDYFYNKMVLEEIADSFDFLMKERIPTDHLFVYASANPAYVYYTSIHPEQKQWNSLKGAKMLKFDANFDLIGRSFSGKNALIYSWEESDKITAQQNMINAHIKTVKTYLGRGSKVYIYDQQ